MFSLQQGNISYLINSYDEGFYGYDALLADNLETGRWLSTVILRSLFYFLPLCPLVFLICDFLFPATSGLLAFMLFSRIFQHEGKAAVAALFFLMAPEIFCNRSVFLPSWLNLGAILAAVLDKVLFWAPGLVLNNNPTGTFWLFRTPEPQISQSLAYGCMWIAVTKVYSGCAMPSACLQFFGAGLFFLLPFSYVFVATPFVFTAFFVLALGDKRPWLHRWELLALLGGCLTKIIIELSLKSPQVNPWFESRSPTVTLSSLIGLGLFFLSRNSPTKPKIKKIAQLGLLIPMVICNQQLLTGRALMLNNFENFSLPQIVFFSAVILLSRK